MATRGPFKEELHYIDTVVGKSYLQRGAIQVDVTVGTWSIRRVVHKVEAAGGITGRGFSIGAGAISEEELSRMYIAQFTGQVERSVTPNILRVCWVTPLEELLQETVPPIDN